MQVLSGNFCGTELAKRHTAGLHVVESVFQPNETLPWHTHCWPYFTFVLRGGYTEECHGRTFDLVEGDVVLHGAGEAHADRMHDTESCLLNLEFTQPWLDRIAAFGARLDCRVTCNGGDFLQLGKRLHRELWSDEPIVDIALRAGFADHSHMSRVFRQETGLTPTEFRHLRCGA